MGLKETVFSCIQDIDLFAQPITLNLNGNLVFRTFFGGITTLVTLILLFFFSIDNVKSSRPLHLPFILINFFYDNRYRNSWTKVHSRSTCHILNQNSHQLYFALELIIAKTSRLFKDDPPLINMDITNFMFAVSIEQDDFLTRPYYDVIISHRSVASLQSLLQLTISSGTIRET